MKNGSVKVAVSVPRRVFDRVEGERKRRRESRSRLVVEALEDWLKRADEAKQVRRYIDGYRRMPESERDSKWLTRVAVASIAAEEWK